MDDIAGARPAPPDDLQALNAEIERTRAELGETVEALAARADVKARAQDKANQIAGRAQDKANEIAGRAQDKANEIAGRLTGTFGQVKEKAAAMDRRVPMAAGFTAMVLVGWLIVRRRRR